MSSASVEPTGDLAEDTLLGHPRGLYILFLTEMWERFSYYGMRALLMLYLTKHFLFGDQSAGLLYGSYASLVYAMPVLGGLIADRYLGLKKAVMFGAVLLVCGHLGMAVEGPPSEVIDGVLVRQSMYEQAFYLSLAFIVVGVGFLKSSISTIVGLLYADNDPRRDSGFTIFYMGINLGAFVATLLCAYLGETYGWKYGFGVAGVGMLFGLLTFIRGDRYLANVGAPPLSARLDEPGFLGIKREWIIYGLSLMSIVAVWQMIQRTGDLGYVLSVFGLVVVGGVIWYSLTRCTRIERDRMLVMLTLIVLSVFFWALFEQAGSSLTLFTDRNVAMGDTFTAGMFQSLNPLFIIFLAPIFAWVWAKLAQRRLEPSTPLKFGLGIFQVGLGFAVLIYGAGFAGPDGKVAIVWLALMYLFHTTGELCLSPVGLSMVTRLSVAQVGGMMMGVWFLSSAFAAYMGGVIAGAMAIGSDGAQVAIGAQSLDVYTSVFGKLAWLAIGIGVALMVISPWLAKRMHLDATREEVGRS